MRAFLELKYTYFFALETSHFRFETATRIFELMIIFQMKFFDLTRAVKNDQLLVNLKFAENG